MLIPTFFNLLFLSFHFTQSLTPSETSPITPSISNESEQSDYTFTFTPSSPIPVNGSIEITFPPEYMSTLGIPIVYDDTCSIPCEINGNIVKMYFVEDMSAGVEYEVKVFNVRNPSRGGTGNF